MPMLRYTPSDQGFVQPAVVADLSSYLGRCTNLMNWHVFGVRRLAPFAFDINDWSSDLIKIAREKNQVCLGGFETKL